MKIPTSKVVSGVVPQPQPQPALSKTATSASSAAAKFKRDELSTGVGGALRRQAATQLASTTTTTLRTERLGDGTANCLERAIGLAKPTDTIVLLDDRRDSSGHALVQHPDGTVTDPNHPQVTYGSIGQWQAANPSYSVVARANAGAVQVALKLAPGGARDAALAALGLSKAANVPVADSTPEWVQITGRVRSVDDPSVVMPVTIGSAAEVIHEVPQPLLGELSEAYGTTEGTWYEVELESGDRGYVWSNNTTQDFDSVLSGDLGAPTSPAHTNESGELEQSYELGTVTLGDDGVREITTSDGTVSEVQPEWGQLIPNARVRDENGNRINGLGGQPIHLVRELSDTEDQIFDTAAGSNETWFQVKLMDGATAYVSSENLGELATDTHLGSLVPAEFGAPTSPMVPVEGGGQLQTFEHGSVAIDAQGNVTVSNADGEKIAERASNTTPSIADANSFHVTQRTRQRAAETDDAGVPVNSAGVAVGNPYNDGSEWFGYNDCGPTSVVMAASMVGAITTPDAAGAGEAINTVREAILDRVTPDAEAGRSQTMGVADLIEGLEASGAAGVATRPASIDALNAALDAGNPVILGGDPMDSWGADDPNYIEAGSGGFPHWVVISGRTAEGNYIVNDPLAPGGAIEVSPEQIASYLDPGMGMIEAMPR